MLPQLIAAAGALIDKYTAHLNRWAKLGLVLGGYLVALVVSVVAVMLYDRRFTAQDNQTMGGMIAGGEMFYFCGMFTLISIAPTGLALWFVRMHRKTWAWFSGGCITFAVLGLITVMAMMMTRGLPQHALPPALLFAELFGLTHELGFPVWLGGFLLFAFLAPWQDLRRRLVIAAALEAVVGVFALVHFLPAYLP